VMTLLDDDGAATAFVNAIAMTVTIPMTVLADTDTEAATLAAFADAHPLAFPALSDADGSSVAATLAPVAVAALAALGTGAFTAFTAWSGLGLSRGRTRGGAVWSFGFGVLRVRGASAKQQTGRCKTDHDLLHRFLPGLKLRENRTAKLRFLRKF
jgi:hypothetical protein